MMLKISWRGCQQAVSTSVVSLILCETGLVFLMLPFLFLSCFYLMNLDPLKVQDMVSEPDLSNKLRRDDC